MKFVSTFFESKNFSLIRFFSVSFIVCHSPFVISQGIHFELVYGTQSFDDAKCIIQTFDSGYVVVGTTSGFGNGMTDMYLTKISKFGNVSWQKAIGGINVEKGNSVIQTPDSGYAVVGYTNSSGNGGYDVYLVRTDSSGNPLWSKTYGGTDWDFGYSIAQTPTGGFIIAGGTYSFGNGNEDVYLIKTDGIGNAIWDTAYGGTNEDCANSVFVSADSGYFIIGYTKSFGQGNEDVYLIKTNANGDTVWTKTYGGTSEDTGSEGKQTTDGGYIIAATTKSFDTGLYYENWFIKTNSSGNTQWIRRDSSWFNRIVTSVCQTFDGGYIFVAHQDNIGQYDYLLYKTDSDGWYQSGFTNTYGGNYLENAFSVKQTYDSGFVVVGITQSYGAGEPNIYVVKTDNDIHSTGSVVIVVSVDEHELIQKNISLFPNPVADYFIVRAEEISVLEIFDAYGRLVSANNICRGNNNISTSELPDGIYFIQVRNEEHIASGKMIVRH